MSDQKAVLIRKQCFLSPSKIVYKFQQPIIFQPLSHQQKQFIKVYSSLKQLILCPHTNRHTHTPLYPLCMHNVNERLVGGTPTVNRLMYTGNILCNLAVTTFVTTVRDMIMNIIKICLSSISNNYLKVTYFHRQICLRFYSFVHFAV